MAPSTSRAANPGPPSDRVTTHRGCTGQRTPIGRSERDAAEDAETGIALAVARGPDLVVMDVSLPGMDGYDATRRLKGDAAAAHIPVVALTAHAAQVDRERAAGGMATLSTRFEPASRRG
jgi:CheY-like chemotaxis protein